MRLASDGVPDETIKAFARTIHHEATRYGFSQIDTVRLINVLMDLSIKEVATRRPAPRHTNGNGSRPRRDVDARRYTTPRVQIRLASLDRDAQLLDGWIRDEHSKHFLLSCATAQRLDACSLLSNPANEVGIVELLDGTKTPIGAVAYLDIDPLQRRAELRKLIGVESARGKGYAHEATLLWIQHGLDELGLEKIYLSTLQTHIRNIKLNEKLGFRVEGVLRDEVLLDGQRRDVLRMGLYARHVMHAD